MLMKLQKILTENLVKTQIISDPKLMPFDSLKRTGELYSRNFLTLTIILAGIALIFPDGDDTLRADFFRRVSSLSLCFSHNIFKKFAVERKH